MEEEYIKVEDVQRNLEAFDQFLTIVCNSSKINYNNNLTNNTSISQNMNVYMKIDSNINQFQVHKDISNLYCKSYKDDKNNHIIPNKRFRSCCIKQAEYKFKILKRENVDKKIMKFVKKYIKTNTYYLKNEFLSEFTANHYNPPFSSSKRNVVFKSLNYTYLKWLFAKEEFYQVFLEIMDTKFYALFDTLIKTYQIADDCSDKDLLFKYLKDYINIYKDKV
jgi:hypothetical protein